MQACPRCGTPIIPHMRFCQTCGLDFSTVQPPSRPSQAPAYPPPSQPAGYPAPPRPAAPPPERHQQRGMSRAVLGAGAGGLVLCCLGLVALLGVLAFTSNVNPSPAAGNPTATPGASTPTPEGTPNPAGPTPTAQAAAVNVTLQFAKDVRDDGALVGPGNNFSVNDERIFQVIDWAPGAIQPGTAITTQWYLEGSRLVFQPEPTVVRGQQTRAAISAKASLGTKFAAGRYDVQVKINGVVIARGSFTVA